MSSVTQPVPAIASVEASYLDRMVSMTRAQIVATQREIAELEESLLKRRAQLTIVLQAAVVLRIDLLPAQSTDATPPFSLAGVTGGGVTSRGGN